MSYYSKGQSTIFVSRLEKRGNLEQKSFLSYVDHKILLNKGFITILEKGHSGTKLWTVKVRHT